jgi:hypothetical protein
MANGRNPGRNKRDSSREPGAFVALPWSVLDSVAYARLSHPARALLLEFARQYCRDNNGRLLASRAYLGKRGWKSSDVISRAIRQLIAEGFIHQTVMGHRPNKASWYAITWYTLDKLKGYDVGVELLFRRGSYSRGTPLIPSKGAGKLAIAPSGGTGSGLATPRHGTISPVFVQPSAPSRGHHLDKPSAVLDPCVVEKDVRRLWTYRPLSTIQTDLFMRNRSVWKRHRISSRPDSSNSHLQSTN